MKNLITTMIKDKMKEHLNQVQMDRLMDALEDCLKEIFPQTDSTIQQDYIKIFLSAKRVEGCSEKTVRYYDSTISIKKKGLL